MAELANCGVLVAGALAVSIAWGRSLWYIDERMPSVRRVVFFLMSFTSRQAAEVRSLLLTALYYLIGVLAAVVFAAVFGLDVKSAFAFRPGQTWIVLLGVVGEISVCSLLVDAACRWAGWGTPAQFAELREIPWTKGLRELPPVMVPFVAAAGGLIEEVFFRGVLLKLLTERMAMHPACAIALCGALFCVEQLLQVQTRFQAMVIGAGCVAISLVGGLLVVVSGSVIPAALGHVSFVVFFMSSRKVSAAGPIAGTRGWPR